MPVVCCDILSRRLRHFLLINKIPPDWCKGLFASGLLFFLRMAEETLHQCALHKATLRVLGTHSLNCCCGGLNFEWLVLSTYSKQVYRVHVVPHIFYIATQRYRRLASSPRHFLLKCKIIVNSQRSITWFRRNFVVFRFMTWKQVLKLFLTHSSRVLCTL